MLCQCNGQRANLSFTSVSERLAHAVVDAGAGPFAFLVRAFCMLLGRILVVHLPCDCLVDRPNSMIYEC